MKQLLDELLKRGETLGSIESLTAGLFASEVANIPGASKVFKGSLVTYSPLLKEKLLDIKEEEIAQYGVVSERIAYLMAKKGQEVLGVDMAISFTGNAGPTTEPGGEPVGRVYIGIAYHDEVIVEKCLFNGSRNVIRSLSKDKAVELAKKSLKL